MQKKSLAILLTSILSACSTPPFQTTAPPSSSSNSGLQQELDKASQLNASSAQLSVTQAQNAYFGVTGELLNIPLEVSAYERLEAEVLPPMLAAANALALSTETNANVKADYQRLFDDISQQLLRGINNNLSLYQGVFESSQTLANSIDPPADIFQALTDIFQATEYTERYLAQLGQFSQLLPNGVSLLRGIENQQAVVVNGVLKTLDQVEDPLVLQQGYEALIKTLTRPQLLPVLTQLAVKVYGAENVALRQPELTPVQTNPNPTDAVIRESEQRYRLIKVENGRIQHTIVTDSRGLSASDYLNQTTVVQVQNPAGT
jgi:hypothetical protein